MTKLFLAPVVFVMLQRVKKTSRNLSGRYITTIS
jgi:hypothetical protein